MALNRHHSLDHHRSRDHHSLYRLTHSQMHLSLNIILAIILAVLFVLVWGGLYTFFYGWLFQTSLKHSKYNLHIVMMRRPHRENPEQFELPNLVV